MRPEFDWSADTLRTAFRELNKISVSLPFGLSLLGDVSGTGVVVAGYLPEESRAPSAAGKPVSPDDLRFMAVLQPKSWLAVAAANGITIWTITKVDRALGEPVEFR